MNLLERINLLPCQLINSIYEYDGRYRALYSLCIHEIRCAYLEREKKLIMLRNEVRYREYVRSWITHYSSFYQYFLYKYKKTKIFPYSS